MRELVCNQFSECLEDKSRYIFGADTQVLPPIITNKSRLFAPAFSDWGGVVEEIRTVFLKTDKYVYIPDLR